MSELFVILSLGKIVWDSVRQKTRLRWSYGGREKFLNNYQTIDNCAIIKLENPV
jgi:hypothetical protein